MDYRTTEELLNTATDFLTQQNFADLKNDLTSAEAVTLEAGFWQQATAQQHMQFLAQLQNQVKQLAEFQDQLSDLETALFLWGEASGEENSPEAKETALVAHKLATTLKKLQTAAYLSGPYDQQGALFSIHSGQGGTEAMDWAEMVSRMYQRFFERQGWKYQLIDESRGEEAGIKAVSFEIAYPAAYGYLKHERGAHRLVRLSPFNADSLRQTSFALVEVMPLIDEADQNIKIADTDLEWHYTRAGGPGGQNVNKVNSAVELFYRPLELTIRCREERSQEQNKQRALKILRAQIAILQEEKQAQELAQVKGKFVQASWGNQIRNYVLHPYHLVKDTRTGFETTATEAVLDGEINDFIAAELAFFS